MTRPTCRMSQNGRHNLHTLLKATLTEFLMPGRVSNESAFTMQPTSTIAGTFFAIQNVPAEQQTEISIHQPKPVRAFNPVPQLIAALSRRTPSPPVDTSGAALKRTPSPLDTSGQRSVSPPLDEYPLLAHPNSRVHPLFMFHSSKIAQGQFSTQQNIPFVPAPAPGPTTPKQTRRTFSFRHFSPEDESSGSLSLLKTNDITYSYLLFWFAPLLTLPPFRRYFLSPRRTFYNLASIPNSWPAFGRSMFNLIALLIAFDC